jgi:hypothetical protein
MAQHDYVISNASGATVRADINSALSAIQTLNSGTSAPSSTAAGMLWLDTTGGAPYALKVRDAGNNHWLTLASVTDPGSDGNIETSATIKGTIDSSADLSNANFPYATQSQVFGTHTTGTITGGTNSLTVASSAGISNGDFVVAEGITPGTTVSSGAGTTTLVLSANALQGFSSDPVMFYSAVKMLSPGLVGGMLCRAWCNFNGTGTITIRGSANVSSLTDHETGVYSVNFATDLPDGNYVTTQMCGNDGDSGTSHTAIFGSGSARTTSAVKFRTIRVSTSGSTNDEDVVNIACFR